MRAGTQQASGLLGLPCLQLIRPKTAHVYSFKKLTEILQGKYMQIQNKAPNKPAIKNVQDKRNPDRSMLSQTRLQSAKRVCRNPSIDNAKLNREVILINTSSNQKINLISLQNFKKRTSMRSATTKQIKIEKENQGFVPYAQQTHYFPISQPVIQKFNKTKKRVSKKEELKVNIEKPEEETEIIDSWKDDEEQNMEFSTLFKTAWRF